jgi:hypothetical protein
LGAEAGAGAVAEYAHAICAALKRAAQPQGASQRLIKLFRAMKDWFVMITTLQWFEPILDSVNAPP